MYIQEIIIDGFKSYAQKTVVSGFDPQFNAITGLNGSGKSNILDSICFVLGISNLTQVRVGNLQELVYKQGQAGVTKASVTIVFNNDDTVTSPVGYESHKQITVTRQVVLGGKNKYMINGHTVQQSQVQNLFHSVQLNVNNPHFLIMQGRITKVLNMKPPETLSMIEEAAGTRMFENKKQAAIKTIEKKQLKVEEISNCMNNEITPTLENLRTERSNYLNWQSNNSELERLERFCIACEYQEVEIKVNRSDDDRKSIQSELDAHESLQNAKQNEAELCTTKISELERIREGDIENGLSELKKIESDLSKEMVKAKATLTNQKETAAGEKEIHSNLTKQLETVKNALVEKQAEFTQCSALLKEKEIESTECEQEAAALRDRYQNACAGVADDNSRGLLSIPEQVASWEKKAREANSQMQQGILKVSHVKESIKNLKKTLKSQQSTFDSATKESDTIKSQVTALEAKLAAVSVDEAKESQLRIHADELRSNITGLRDHADNLAANIEARLNFDYKDPEKGFDRNRVKGLLARLVNVKDRKAATALEIAAGAKLYQVIVDTEQTGKLLLQKGQLKKRVTILPLNKVAYRSIDPSKLMKAKQIASAMRGSAQLALDLVSFDESVRKAMEFTFGSVIICDSSDIAKAIAYDKSIACRTVTLEGDSFDPSGTVTGGSSNNIGVLLAKIEEHNSVQVELNRMKNEYNRIVDDLSKLEAMTNTMRDTLSALEMKKHSLKLCEDKLASSSYSQTMAQISAMEEEVQNLEKESETLKQTHKKASDELKKLKDTESNLKKDREKAMKDMENQVKSATKRAGAAKAEVTALKNRRDGLSAEINALTKEMIAVKDQITSTESSLAKLTKETDALNHKLNEAKTSYENAQQAVAEKQQELNACSKEIKSLVANREKCLKAVQAASLEARKVQHKLKQWEKDFKDASRALANLLKTHPWLEKERAYFGVPGSDFDFAAKDVAQSMKRLKDLKADQERLSKKINKKVMGMIEKAESEYEDLRRKKEVILNDKAKIEAVIDELDVKKLAALQSTWIKVNRDFGSIFSMLLPGTHAKLEPPEGSTVNDGLEVKVAFNGVWKDSLTELSGGQRSLLALSLILALLLFKPAPMYILDEVDAALDLSHTQNIGLMLRTHFSTSQFIVVSLKEGMFNNANVIFRTKFVDGVSTVSRTVVGGRSNVKAISSIEEGEPEKKKGKGNSKSRGGLKGIENAVES